MSIRQRSGAVVVGAVAAGVLSIGAVAWACTPYPDGDSSGNTPQAPPSMDAPPPAQTVARPEAPPQAEPAPVQSEAPKATASAPAPARTSATPSRSTARTAPSTFTRQPAASAPAAASVAPEPAPAPVVEPAAPALPSMSSVAGDLWSGFDPSSTRAQGASLEGTTSASNSGNEWALGLGLFAAGVVALGAGTGVTLRRRAKAHAASQG